MPVTSSTELAKTQVTTNDGVVVATLVDRVSPERIMLMQVRGAAAARYGDMPNNTPRVSKQLRTLVVHPRVDDE
jgi:hypothetical protein